MNFELKPLGLVAVASEKCDALIVLVPQDFKAGKDDLSVLVGNALKSSDLEAKPGKILSLYRPMQANAVHERVHQKSHARQIANIFQHAESQQKWKKIWKHDRNSRRDTL